jgi:hypothetical protein
MQVEEGVGIAEDRGALDPALRGLVEAPDEPSADRALGALLHVQAVPLIRRVAARKLRGLRDAGGSFHDDLHDITADVLVSLVSRLHSLRRAPQDRPIASFEGYTAAVTFHAFARFVRHRPPRHDELCDPPAAVEAGARAMLADASAETQLDRRRLTARAWSEIVALPFRHRIALLLSLRDGDGGLLWAFAASRAVTVREIAQALEMREDELTALWPDLPWADRRIAALLGCTRQQVINLRASARKRLARRLGPDAGRAWAAAP